ncbi:MAG: hypothetical protein KA066_02240, partial [Candidatus Pacebacteria bacterium]|nr:hypothetical protein [Candidatus Paceibacterota bacterium]
MLLSNKLTEHFRLTDAQKSALERLGLRTVHDLLHHFPSRYEVAGEGAEIAGLVAGQEASIVGTLEKLEAKKGWKSRIPMTEGYLRDNTGRIKCRWFNQPYISKMYADGTLVRATGKVSGAPGKLYLANPQLQKVSPTEAGLFEANQNPQKKSLGGGGQMPGAFGDKDFFSADSEQPDLFAVYPESRGTTSLWMRHAVAKFLTTEILEQVEDPIPPELLKNYNLPTLRTALVWVHT